MIKCVFCKGVSKKGVHDVCWRKFKGFMLSDRVSFSTDQRSEAYDELMVTDEPHRDRQGRYVVEGRVLPTDDDQFRRSE